MVVGTSSSDFNPLVLRTSLAGSPTLGDLVRKVKACEEEAYSKSIPFDKLVAALMESGDVHEGDEMAPLFQARDAGR